MMQGLKKRTRKAFGIRKKEKDNDSAGSPDRDGGKKTNGVPNGFHGDMDWDRFNTPEVDEEGYSVRPGEDSGDEAEQPVKKEHFYSSDESDGEEEHRKKFKIKIKPLPPDRVVTAPSVDMLKASIGNIALSPSPMRSPRRSPGLQRNTSNEEIVRPRRIAPTLPPVAPAPQTAAPTPAPAPRPPSPPTPVSEDTTALFGPPLDTSFGEPKTEVDFDSVSDAWSTPLSDSAFTRSFPTGTPPPLPPKIVPSSPPPTGPPSAADAEASTEVPPFNRKPSIDDLDNIFGPEQLAAPAGFSEDTTAGDCSWVCFTEESSSSSSQQQLPAPEDPAPPLLVCLPPLPESPPPPLPSSPPPLEEPAPPAPSLPPLPLSPPPVEEPVSPIPTSPTSSEEPEEPEEPTTPENQNSPTHAPSLPSPLPKELSSPPIPTSPPPVLDSPTSPPPQVPPPPKPRTPPAAVTSPAEEQPAFPHVPPQPLALSQEEQGKSTDTEAPQQPKEDLDETLVTSPVATPVVATPVVATPIVATPVTKQPSRTSPPPPPPPTYRAVVTSSGSTTGTGGTNSGASSPVRPATPSSVNPTPPPPPPRPPSRPKLPPGKPPIGDATRAFSPPVHCASPPPTAPLARAESTSSISSSNSTATTPTVGKELSLSVTENDQPSLVWFDRGKFYLTFEGCSRGPSPLTMGAQDTLPVAAAFTETVNAFFKGADPNKCVMKIIGEMVLSFPAGITRHFATNPSPAVLTFSITNYSRLEHVLPNPQLLCCDTTQAKADSKDFWVNMPNLISHLKKVAEQKPQATYYNVDMLKYQVSVDGLQSIPLNLAVSWRCEPTSTDLRIDYKYNADAMETPTALNNVQFLVPIDGGVSKLQAVLPPAAWNAEQQRILWKIPEISKKSENGGVGSLLARFQLSSGPSRAAPLAVQFTSEGSTLSGCDIQLAGPGYRFSLVKRRFAAGKYLADNN